MDAANMTLMRAKDSDEDILFFSSDQTVERLEAFALLEELYQSAEGDFSDFSLVYQPIFKKDGTLASLEALLRYNSPTRGRVMPGEFIPLLESSKLIRKVGAWVLRTALTDLKEWRKTLPELTVSVNFSSVQLEDSHIADQVMSTLEDVGVPASALTVEFTESRSLVNNDKLKSTLHYLKTAGVKYSLDDFGTGRSNLDYIVNMPVQIIKFDYQFTHWYFGDDKARNVVEGTASIIRNMGLPIVAEGVENEEQLEAMIKLGASYIQGFYFSKPLSKGRFVDFMRKNQL
jgi:EAL domain-containing protein (putative c-di-GMP-specific phosphodiesterase class I)